MGLTPPGQGWRAALDGWTSRDGILPVNRSGGLKSKRHPVGATGVPMHAMAAMQLTGQAGDMQLPTADRRPPTADRGAACDMGGSGVANDVSILQRTG